MASKEKGISSGQWYISVVPLDQIIVQVVISFSKDALNGLPLREHIVNRSRHLTFGKQVRLTLYPEQFPFYFAEYLRRIPFPVPEVIFVCPSLSTNTVFMFFLIQLVRQFNDLLCFRFLLYLKELPFDMLQAGDSFNSRIGVTFQFSIRTVCVTLYRS